MRLLLDEHLSLDLAVALKRRGIEAETLQTWLGGSLLSASDEEVLAAASTDQRILITADQRLPPLLRRLAESERHHAGIIFVTQSDANQRRVGSVAARLAELLKELADVDWTDRTAHLPPP